MEIVNCQIKWTIIYLKEEVKCTINTIKGFRWKSFVPEILKKLQLGVWYTVGIRTVCR